MTLGHTHIEWWAIAFIAACLATAAGGIISERRKHASEEQP